MLLHLQAKFAGIFRHIGEDVAGIVPSLKILPGGGRGDVRRPGSLENAGRKGSGFDFRDTPVQHIVLDIDNDDIVLDIDNDEEA